jgi:hypothetical protein
MRRVSMAILALLLLSLTLATAAAAAPDRGAFQRIWARTDQPVADGKVQRTWYWGPAPIMTVEEPYLEGPGGMRLVQYFDKGRMEITNPNDDPRGEWYVTSGLLAREMVSGRVQVGDNEFERRAPLALPIAGDMYDNPSAPTYASFREVASIRYPSPGEIPLPFPWGPGVDEPNSADPRIGKFVTELIDRNGQIEIDQSLASSYPGTRIVHFDLNGAHNIPEIFWSFLNKEGLVQDGAGTGDGVLANWIYLTGYPITEPYWVRTRVGGAERWVLVQIFERRVLTYNPLNPAGWQVEMGNVGLHYLAWADVPPPPPIELPENVDATVDPRSGPGGTDFAVTLFGFTPGESVNIWLTLPDGETIPWVEEDEELPIANAEGVVDYYGDTVIPVFTFPGLPTGIYNMVGQGIDSGKVSIAYFELTD